MQPAVSAIVHGVSLSPQQRRLWEFHRGGGLAPVHGVVRIDGALDAERLRRALAAVVSRHEILRTAFRRDARLAFPLQVPLASSPPAWIAVDLQGRSTDEQDAAVAAQVRAAAHAVFDVEHGPMVAATLLRRGREQHDLFLAIPALCADAWTLRMLVRELAEGYATPAPGIGRADDPEPIQYAQFAEWQHELLRGDARRRGDAIAPVRLPFEDAMRGAPGALVDGAERDLDAALAAELATRARRDGVSLGAALLAAFQVVLARLTGRRELVVAVGCAGRTLEDVQGVFGPVATWRAVPAWLDDAGAFRDLVRQAHAAIEDAEQADDESFDLAPVDDPRGLAGLVGFAFDELPEPVVAAGLSWQLAAQGTPFAGPRLALTVQRRGAALRLSLRHGRQLAAGGADALLDQIAAAIASAVAGWAAPIARLSLVGSAERARLLAAGHGRRLDDGEPRLCLHDAFRRHAEQRPDALAVVGCDQQLTYRELSRRASRLAHQLRRLGVTTGSPVGLICERSVPLIVGILGILDAGGAYVPLDPRAPSERLAQQIRHAGCAVLVTVGGVRVAATDAAIGAVISWLSLDDVALSTATADDEPLAPRPSVPLDELASIVFTSGSTGVPKGVAITHRGIASYTRAVCDALGVEPGLSFATVSTPSADLGNTSIFASLATGGCLHVIDHETAVDGARFAAYARRWPIDVLKIVPSHLSALLDAGDAAVVPRRLLVLGGEALPLPLVERLSALAPGCAIANHYGPTETTVGALVLPLRLLDDSRGCASVPIGRPLAHADAYVLDAALAPAPVGAVGELYLGGEGVARGYIDQPAATAERFVPDPFGAGARLYRTGDQARVRPDGTIEFAGRRDHQLKIRGFRVELGEIEARLREHPAIERAVVVAVGAASATLVAYVVPRDGALDEPALRAFLKDRVPDYMIPGTFVALAALPLTTNGKIDRQALPRPPDREKRAHVAPRTPTEATIAALWAQALGVAQVSVDDDFFELGGHSLLAIPLVHRIRQALGVPLSAMAIFQAPTVARLASLLDTDATASSAVRLRARAADNAAPPATDATSARAPLFCVDPTGWHVTAYQPLADALGDDLPVFGLEIGLTPDGASVAERCEHLAREVRRVQPRGPVHLLGWSLGGVLALGIARVLEAQGEAIAFLGILDTQPRTQLYAGGPPDLIAELAEYVDPTRKAELLALSPDELAAVQAQWQRLPDDQRATAAAAWAQQRGLLPADAAPEALGVRYRLLREAALFLNELPPRCLKVPIHLWWSTETLARHGAPPEDFQRFTSAALHEATARGDHLAAVQGGEVHAQIRAILANMNTDSQFSSRP